MVRSYRGNYPVAKGHTRNRVMRQINCYFDDETFVQIRELVEKNGWSMSETVRVLVEIGLEEYDDAE